VQQRKRKLRAPDADGLKELDAWAAGSVALGLPMDASAAAGAPQASALLIQTNGRDVADVRRDKKHKAAAEQRAVGDQREQQKQQQAGSAQEEATRAAAAAAASAVRAPVEPAGHKPRGRSLQVAVQATHEDSEQQQQPYPAEQQQQQQGESKGGGLVQAASLRPRLPRSLQRLQLPRDLSDTRRGQLQEAALVLLVLRALHQAANAALLAAEEQQHQENLYTPSPGKQKHPSTAVHVVRVEDLHLPAALLACPATSSDAGASGGVSSVTDIIDAWCQGTLIRCDAGGTSMPSTSSSCRSCVRVDPHFRKQLLRHAVLKEVRQTWLAKLAEGFGGQEEIQSQRVHTLLDGCRVPGLPVYMQVSCCGWGDTGRWGNCTWLRHLGHQGYYRVCKVHARHNSDPVNAVLIHLYRVLPLAAHSCMAAWRAWQQTCCTRSLWCGSRQGQPTMTGMSSCQQGVSLR
jgi:hypothetical protein